MMTQQSSRGYSCCFEFLGAGVLVVGSVGLPVVSVRSPPRGRVVRCVWGMRKPAGERAFWVLGDMSELRWV
jgi:hypothetical protein